MTSQQPIQSTDPVHLYPTATNAADPADGMAAQAIACAAADPFLPHPWLRQGHLQTLLSRIKPRLLAAKDDQPVLIDGGPDYCDTAALAAGPRRVRLMGYFTPHTLTDTLTEDECPTRRGLALLLHGWQGCSHSNYNLALTGALTHAGFDVLRLNLRDHGPGLHLQPQGLNPGIFLGVLIDEVAHAVQQIAALANGTPFYIIGASMGGNFALRLAEWHSRAPFPNLRKVIAVNPVIDPAHSTDRVDGHPFYRRYFRRRWFESLLAKQQLFPQLYDFADLAGVPTIRAMTEQVLQRYGHRLINIPAPAGVAGEMLPHFADADEYFAAYAIHKQTLSALTVETQIISALDDPIIAANAMYDLPTHPRLTLQLHPTGGHVGYVNLFPVEHHLPQLILRSLLAEQ